ncbi:MAG TPA: transposase [Accumulibacter sp.]|uniref:transposase n=1 Tax=Accumulibacter sp. TaxID=2053492 RepID=UPI002C1E95B7|nr:transposase [Accumulibacter sp.]HMW57380.1 transposase [Accumulibacter sp.]
MDYRRAQTPGGTCFFTVNLADPDSDTLVRHLEALRTAMTTVREAHPFKLLAMVVLPNHLGELLGVKLTPGKVDDRKPLRLFGKRYADKGDIAQWLTTFLKDLGIDFVTKVRKNRKPVALDPFDEAMLRQRSLVETVIDELRNLCQIEHTCHRSPIHFAVNLLAVLIAHCLMPNQPKLSLQDVRRLSQSLKLIRN